MSWTLRGYVRQTAALLLAAAACAYLGSSFVTDWHEMARRNYVLPPAARWLEKLYPTWWHCVPIGVVVSVVVGLACTWLAGWRAVSRGDLHSCWPSAWSAAVQSCIFVFLVLCLLAGQGWLDGL